MQTKLSKKLYQKTFKHYDNFKDDDKIVGGHPILFFGDLEKYFESVKKVVTIGINPSFNEFKENRFRKNIKTPYSLEQSLCNYFRRDKGRNPYTEWFDNYNKYLREFRCTFYNIPSYPNRVIHTDICSPLATNPTWSEIEKRLKDDLFNEGFEIWKDLITELEPDFLVMACPVKILLKEKLFNLLDVKEIDCIQTIIDRKDGNPRKPQNIFKLTFNSISINNFSTKLIFGSPSIEVPFGSISNDDIKSMGQKTNNLIQQKID